jgi:hypothetical protein
MQLTSKFVWLAKRKKPAHGPDVRAGLLSYLPHLLPIGTKDLDFGFGFLPVLSEMSEIREFRCFSVKFSDKI